MGGQPQNQFAKGPQGAAGLKPNKFQQQRQQRGQMQNTAGGSTGQFGQFSQQQQNSQMMGNPGSKPNKFQQNTQNQSFGLGSQNLPQNRQHGANQSSGFGGFNAFNQTQPSSIMPSRTPSQTEFGKSSMSSGFSAFNQTQSTIGQGQSQGFNQFGKPSYTGLNQTLNSSGSSRGGNINKSPLQESDMQMDSPYKQPNSQFGRGKDKFQASQFGAQNQQQQPTKRPGSSRQLVVGDQQNRSKSVITKQINQNTQQQLQQNKPLHPASQKREVPKFLNRKQQQDAAASLQPQESIESSRSNSSKPQSLTTTGRNSVGAVGRGGKSLGQKPQNPLNITKQNKPQAIGNKSLDKPDSKKQFPQSSIQTKSKTKLGQGDKDFKKLGDNYKERPAGDDYDDEQEGADEYYDDEYYGEEYYGEEGADEEGNQEEVGSKAKVAAAQSKPNELKIQKAIGGTAVAPIVSGKTSANKSAASKQQICQHYLQGNCRFGDKCNNLHEGGTSQNSSANSKKKIPCRYFLEGMCKNGDKCTFSHEIDESSVGEMMNLIKQSGMKLPPGLDPKMIQQMMQQQQQVDDGGYGDEDLDQGEYDDEEEEIKAKEVIPSVINNKAALKELEPDQIAQQNKGKVLSLASLKEENRLRELKEKALEEMKQGNSPDKIQEQKPTVQQQQKLQPQFQVPMTIVRPKQLVPKKSSQVLSINQLPIQTRVTPEHILKSQQRILNEIGEIQQNANKYKIPGKAELLGPCSAQEIHRRLEIENLSASPFETDRNGDGFQKFAIKCYSRSAADKVMNEPTEIRPPEVLYKVIEYLRECVVDQDLLEKGQGTYALPSPTFSDVYSFVRDRGRCVANDFIILDDESNIYNLKSLEELSRFLIISYHDGYTDQNFGVYQNTQILTKILGSIKNCYKQLKVFYQHDQQLLSELLRNQVEFMSYLIIASSYDPLISQEEISKSTENSVSTSQKKLLMQAIKINHAIQHSDPVSYFKLIESREVNYMFKCMMLYFFNEMRLQLIEHLKKMDPLSGEIDVQFLSKVLRFVDDEDTLGFMESCGFTNMSQDSVYLKERLVRQDWIEKNNIWKQTNRLTFLDEIRGTKPRSYFMKVGIEQDPKEIERQQEEDKQRKLEYQKQQQKQQIERQEYEAQQFKIKQAQEEAERLRSIEEDKKINAQKEQEKLEKQAREKREREEKEQKERARQEKLRIEREAEEKKQKTMKKFKDFIFQYRDFNNKSLLDKVVKVKQGFLEFSREYKKLLGKRKHRDVLQEFETQMIDLFHQDAFIPDTKRYEIVHQLKRLDLDYHEIGIFKMKDWINKVIPNKEGFLQVKLISSRIRPNNSPNQLWELLQLMILLFNNNSADKFLTKQMLITQYSTDINDKLEMSFKYEEIEKLNETQVQNLFVGTNLVMILSQTSSFKKDLQFLKEQLANYSPYSRINIMFMLYGHDFQEICSLQNQLNLSLTEDLRTEKISNLQFLPLCFNLPQKKRNISHLQYPQTLRAILLAYMLKDLEISLIKCKTLNHDQMILQKHSLKEQIDISLKDIDPENLDIKTTQIKQEDNKFKKFIKGIKKTSTDSSIDMYKVTKINELQVLNFWVLMIQELIELLFQSVKDSVQLCVLSSNNYQDLNEQLQPVIQGLNHLKLIKSIKLTQYPLQQNEKFKNHHVADLLLEKNFSNILDENQTISFRNQLYYIYKYKSVTPLSKEFRFFKGSCFYKILYDIFLNKMISHDWYTYIEPIQYQSLTNVNYQNIWQALKESDNQNKGTLDYLQKKFPIDFKNENFTIKLGSATNHIKEQYAKVSQDSQGAMMRAVEEAVNEAANNDQNQENKIKRLKHYKALQEYNIEANELVHDYFLQKRKDRDFNYNHRIYQSPKDIIDLISSDEESNQQAKRSSFKQDSEKQLKIQNDCSSSYKRLKKDPKIDLDISKRFLADNKNFLQEISKATAKTHKIQK
eukprot:403342615